jgi:DNA-directed RNA polymerase specialized sigma24 family protein
VAVVFDDSWPSRGFTPRNAPDAGLTEGPPVADDRLYPALEAVLTRFADLVRGVGWRHSLADHEVDELMQAVRVRLWRARGSSEQIAATPASYVYRTAITAALDLVRARRGAREDPIETMHASGEKRLAVRGGQVEEVEAAEFAAVVGQAVNEVTPSRRPVVRAAPGGLHRPIHPGLRGGAAQLRARRQRRRVVLGLERLRAGGRE